ncbi:hypothetical protein GLP30_11085 [Photobacterium phosphoreum]|uniref:Phage head morphogenesis domain-containing protein n=1 Tax=Photobacterium phosphoreum TaxID=659 RepID=A0AAW4ZWD2_PHOPO|nr:hypothetical protein [Photobacterium phosphoreum]MCD9491365.1 hypothetical protein [Photobacterium phosphoreum]MCD9502404.1 hypothetical protein [Photobacterium phosphoreum]MCF2190631.1 hypothetical protein [Photobacterium phosphoreum]MCF2302182.1 hypothetical protein [Photobacterium phosphoreum]
MTASYAKDFHEIPESLTNNTSLKRKVLDLVQSEPIAGKVTAGGSRLEDFREILIDFFDLQIDLNAVIAETERRLPRQQSIFSGDNRVFASGWAERLIRTQISRFYNQAVLETIIESGSDGCFIDHSSSEQASSKCSQQLAGTTHSAHVMLDRLKSSYGDGVWNNDRKLPDHPHCTHTFSPVS